MSNIVNHISSIILTAMKMCYRIYCRMFLHYTVIYLFLNHDSLNLAICVSGAHGVWEGGVCVSTRPSVYMYLCVRMCACVNI